MMSQVLSRKTCTSITALVWFFSSLLAIVGCQSQAIAQVCQTRAYVIDPDPQGLNVRNQPNSQSEIIGNLPLYTEVNVLEHQNNWLFISPINPELQEVDFQGEGWVYASLLGLNTRGYNSNNVALYSEPRETSEVVGYAESSSSVTMVSCSGEWVLVRSKNIQGWLNPEEQCAAALTTCP
ncbi:MAG: SH3 domain-containing protein [Gomphosphaeria aponina SAG 52.96 = DSM 107014]|uniref:SH3 domain-containing protein n=1 Tax=Gomphosphaeria aponina SAG 52.96 = DSM 107014 TaxID=1521640 RepID=A0A941GW72_9CHRO|nr:SH3 domain-containing protein [Gomphosphaeria aponina SAG 52.96 = DSM 107014]